MELAVIKKALKEKYPITEAETAFLLRNDIEALLAFMVENNIGNVNYTLRNIIGYDNLSFNPVKDAVVRQLQILVDRKNLNELDTVIRNFKIDESKLTPTLLALINNEFSK